MSGFLAAYHDKGRMSHFTNQIPVRIALVDDLGMKGSHLVAARIVKDLHKKETHRPPSLGTVEVPIPALVAAVAAVTIGAVVLMRNK
jgi:hypothetical protein